MSDGPSWQTLGIIGACVAAALTLYWRATVIFASAKDQDKLESRINDLEDHPMTCPFVSKESLAQQLKPIIDEQEHRRKSTENLGKALADMQKTVHRMDKGITAIATHLKVDLVDTDEEAPRK